MTRHSPLPLTILAALLATCGGTSTPANPDAGTAGFSFQPTNINLSDITANQATAVAENVVQDCTIGTDPASPGSDCFTSPIVAIKQFDGSSVNLVVVKSLTVVGGVKVTASGKVPLVIVSLADLTWGGQLLANSTTAHFRLGPGGTLNLANATAGPGPGGGPAASSFLASGAGGGSYCGKGGPGGGSTITGSSYGGLIIRPLVGGCAGGSGATNAGSGGGGVQLVAAGTLSVTLSGVITVGGAGGQIGGVATGQNASAGGSGGAILLEALTVSVAGTLAANGGGGGGDYSQPPGGDATADANPAPGAPGGNSEGPGGAGGAGTSLSGGAGSVSGVLNAGAGGGGVGRIEIDSMSGMATLTGTLSPSMGTLCTVQQTLRTLAEGP